MASMCCNSFLISQKGGVAVLCTSLYVVKILSGEKGKEPKTVSVPKTAHPLYDEI